IGRFNIDEFVKSQRTPFCHSGESRNPVYSNSYQASELRFSPEYDLDLFHEAQLAALLQKGVTGDPTILPAEKVFSMLTIDGARAVGLAERVGSLEVGKQADLAVIDFDSANLTPSYDLYSHFIYAIAASNVRHVMIDGKMVMQDRQLLTLDEGEVKSQVRQIAEKVRLI
ncbi:MAG: amidohydrolase family protein, partial [Anaerolineaceae bacterium]|nr:amidohydrolase family protein [Anaerolineaceae bacterium]